MVSSESISLDVLNYKNITDIDKILIFKKDNKVIQEEYNFNLTPCIFEYVYLARPETTINKISVYQARINMGLYLAKKSQKNLVNELKDINAIIPVPDSSLIASTKLAEDLDIPLKFGIIKNRYIDRTFIMKNQKKENNIKRKLFIVKQEVYNKNIIVVDDSIVRGNTSKHIINELRFMEQKKYTLLVVHLKLNIKIYMELIYLNKKI